MWPFKKKQIVEVQDAVPEQMFYSQVDITERFDDNLNLKPEDWITTIPLNSIHDNPASMGVPAVNASIEEVYQFASALSLIRESILVPDDGVYCPCCHIANIVIAKLRTPCPQCGRALLKFGWS